MLISRKTWRITTNVNFDDIEKSNVFYIIKKQYEKKTIIEKNTKYNYNVKIKIQADDILDSQCIKNWIQEQIEKSIMQQKVI